MLASKFCDRKEASKRTNSDEQLQKKKQMKTCSNERNEQKKEEELICLLQLECDRKRNGKSIHGVQLRRNSKLK